jgi:hypothetical protein
MENPNREELKGKTFLIKQKKEYFEKFLWIFLKFFFFLVLLERASIKRKIFFIKTNLKRRKIHSKITRSFSVCHKFSQLCKND